MNSPATSSSSVAEIVRLHTEIRVAARTSLDNAIRIGELLTAERAHHGHGQWLPWLKENMPFTERTARNYMRVFEQRDRLKSENVSDLTASYRLITGSERPHDLLNDLPDAATLVWDLTVNGTKRFEAVRDATTAHLKRALERCNEAENLDEVIAVRRDAVRLEQFWTEVERECERARAHCLISGGNERQR